MCQQVRPINPLVAADSLQTALRAALRHNSAYPRTCQDRDVPLERAHARAWAWPRVYPGGHFL